MVAELPAPAGPGREHLGDLGVVREPVLGDADRLEVPPQDLLGPEAGDRGEPGIGVLDHPVEVGDDDHRRALLDGARELAHLLLGPPPLADLAFEAPVGGLQGAADLLQPVDGRGLGPRPAALLAQPVDQVAVEAGDREQERDAHQARAVGEDAGERAAARGREREQVGGADDEGADRDQPQAFADRGQEQDEEVEVEELRLEAPGHQEAGGDPEGVDEEGAGGEAG